MTHTSWDRPYPAWHTPLACTFGTWHFPCYTPLPHMPPSTKPHYTHTHTHHTFPYHTLPLQPSPHLCTQPHTPATPLPCPAVGPTPLPPQYLFPHCEPHGQFGPSLGQGLHYCTTGYFYLPPLQPPHGNHAMRAQLERLHPTTFPAFYLP